MGSAGLVDVTVFRRHDGVVAFQVPPSMPDGTHEAKAATQFLERLGRSPLWRPLRVERPSREMRPRSVQHGGNNASLPALAVDHLGLPCNYGGQDFLLFALRHAEVVQCSGDLCSNLVELFGRDVELFMRFVHVLAGVLKWSAGRLAEPECPHEFKAWQLARLVPFLQGWVHIEFRILDDFVAEAVNDHGNGVDAPDPFVKTLLCHRYSLLTQRKRRLHEKERRREELFPSVLLMVFEGEKKPSGR